MSEVDAGNPASWYDEDDGAPGDVTLTSTGEGEAVEVLPVLNREARRALAEAEFAETMTSLEGLRRKREKQARFLEATDAEITRLEEIAGDLNEELGELEAEDADERAAEVSTDGLER